MSVDARRAGEAIASSAPDLARLWRNTRAQSSPDVWPGLLDGIADDWFLRVGEALEQGRDPALVWPGLAGIVRFDPRDRDRSLAEIDGEWNAFQAVLGGACDALGCGEDVREWMARALVIARSGSRTLDEGGGPRGIVVVWSLSGLASARRPGHDAGRP
ncbi:MAG TPA: hypothetical protein VIV57_24595 [Anaeromyxobacter sp.]